ncbi:MAG: glycoside hydrolase family 18 protein [Fibrobacteraceae bacterium]|nr:glycoside hydrolase family 18 protein [Fibrobacteraceae bacterium]
MNIKVLTLAVAASFAISAQAAADKVVGFYPYWSQYSQFYPKDIRYDFVTHVNYVSLTPSSDGSVAWADENDAGNFKALVDSAANHNVKVVVTIGGIEMESVFQEISANSELTQTFANNVVAWLDEHGGSGVEIDWQNLSAESAAPVAEEAPTAEEPNFEEGATEEGASSEEPASEPVAAPAAAGGNGFGTLLSALKSAFAGKYTLSATVYPFSSLEAYSSDVINDLDYATVFIPDQMSEEETTLKPSQSATLISEGLEKLTGKGVEASKLIPVINLYGRTFAGATGLGSSHNGIGSGNEGYIPYKELMSLFDTPDYKVSFDEDSKSEVAVSAMESIVFMGIPSVKSVAQNIKSGDFGGVAVYDISQDHHEPIVSLLVTIGLELRPEISYKPKKKK